MLVVGCPKGRYKQGRCQVGMVVQSVLKPKLRSNPKSFNEYLGVDEDAARKLELFIENDSDLYRQSEQPIIKNLVKKKKKGIYDHYLATKLWRYHADRGAQKYAKVFGSSGQKWFKMFNVPTRNKVALDFTDHFETEYALGNYDSLLRNPQKEVFDVSKSYAEAIRMKKHFEKFAPNYKISIERSGRRFIVLGEKVRFD